jgi:hypothetical protein
MGMMGWLTTDYIEFEAEEFRDPRLFVRKVYEKVSINLDNPVGVWATIWNGQPPQRATRTQRAVEGTRGLHYWLTHDQELEVAKIDQSEISMIASKVVGWMDGLPEADEPDVNGDGRRIGSDIYVHSPMMRAEISKGGNMIDKKRLKEFFEIVKRKVGYPVFNTRNIGGMAYTRLTMKDQTAIREFQSNLLKDINTKKTFIQKRAASNGDAANSEHLPTGLFEKN